MIEQLALIDYAPPERSRRGEPVAAFVIAGEPQPWKRPKPMKIGGRIAERFQGAYRKWRLAAIDAVSAWWFGQGNIAPVRSPLMVRVVAVFPRPSSPPAVTIAGEVVRYPWPWTAGRNPALVVGDVDNIAKAVLDIVQREGRGIGPLLVDDRFVVSLEVAKFYAAIGEEPRTEVRIWRAA